MIDSVRTLANSRKSTRKIRYYKDWKPVFESGVRYYGAFAEARTVEPEKQPLLANGSETTFVSRQRLRTLVCV
jgi:hypothetical protein